MIIPNRLLKNTHLLRCAHPSSLQRTFKYASFLMISCALQLNVFDQPLKITFSNNLLNHRSDSWKRFDQP
jgi:hypothetical protein